LTRRGFEPFAGFAGGQLLRISGGRNNGHALRLPLHRLARLGRPLFRKMIFMGKTLFPLQGTCGIIKCRVCSPPAPRTVPCWRGERLFFCLLAEIIKKRSGRNMMDSSS
jgi:hypothetical protein